MTREDGGGEYTAIGINAMAFGGVDGLPGTHVVLAGFHEVNQGQVQHVKPNDRILAIMTVFVP